MHNNAILATARPRVLATLVLLVLLTASTIVALQYGPVWLVSWDSSVTIGSCMLLMIVLCAALAWNSAKVLSIRENTLRLTLVIWWFLLISDDLFDRVSDVQSTFVGHFSADAYGEVITWLVAFVAFLLIVLPNVSYLKGSLEGEFRWLFLFVLTCVAAAAYAPSPLYALGWGLKLVLATLTLFVMKSTMKDLDDIHLFFRVLLAGLVINTFLPVIRAFANPVTLFEGVGGRLNADPVVLSGVAACLLLVGLTLNVVERHRWLTVLSLLATLVMLLAFGKTGLLAGLFSAFIFFLLQRKLASGVVLLAAAALMGSVLLATVTPLGNYLKLYRAAGTLTGRTNIWQQAIPAIQQRSLLGHGYLASHFMWVTERGPAGEVAHLHNGFLETLYNTGVVGLVLLLLIHVAIVRNLFRTRLFLRPLLTTTHGATGSPLPTQAYVYLVGCIALYINLLINGLFTVAFGGRATSTFIVFLSLCVVSHLLVVWSGNQMKASDTPSRHIG